LTFDRHSKMILGIDVLNQVIPKLYLKNFIKAIKIVETDSY